MKSLLLDMAGDAGESSSQNRLVVQWDRLEAAPGQLSLPALLRERLLQIRGEHMRWAYETGFLKPDADGPSLAAELCGGAEPSMWWTSLLYERHPRLSPRLYDIYRLRRLEMLMEEENCQALEVRGAEAIISAILANYCQAAGIGFIACGHCGEKKEKKGIAAGIYSHIPTPLRAPLRFAHWWWTIRRRLPFCRALPELPQGEGNAEKSISASIAAYFPNIDMQAAADDRFRSNYWQSLHDALNEEAARERPDGPHFVRWLFIRFPSPHLNFAQCRKLRDAFQKDGGDGLSFNYLEEFLTSRDLAASLWRWLKICLSSAALEKKAKPFFHFENSRINFWPCMREQWRESFQGWRCLERCLQNRAFENYFRMAGPQRWSLFPLENCPWERMLCRAAHKLPGNGPVFGAQHSTIRPTDFRYFDDPRAFSGPEWQPMQPDIVAGNGKSAINQWLANGLPKERLLQVEALRYLHLAKNLPENRSAAWQNLLPPEPGEPLERPSQKRLLILTSFFAGETQAHLALLRRALEAGFLAGWSIVIKPHPYLAVESWLEKLPLPLRQNITVADSPLALELKPGSPVWTSNSTSAALEAALEGLPLLVMWPHEDFDLCPIQDAPDLPRCGDLEDLRQFLVNPRPITLEKDYLDLDAKTPAWRKLLELSE